MRSVLGKSEAPSALPLSNASFSYVFLDSAVHPTRLGYSYNVSSVLTPRLGIQPVAFTVKSASPRPPNLLLNVNIYIDIDMMRHEGYLWIVADPGKYINIDITTVDVTVL